MYRTKIQCSDHASEFCSVAFKQDFTDKADLGDLKKSHVQRILRFEIFSVIKQ